MTDILLFATVIAPIVLAVTQLVKHTVPNLPKEYLPLIALALGVVLAIGSAPFSDLDILTKVWAGFLAGLSSSGFYDLVAKKPAEPEQPTDEIV